ncbi:hypothetical protein [Kineobactrum salinum]|uniref:Uncharacterized protein n=1 Tax=Kineobactrum salinum TaxID=2708301 RepID=A0A6C0U5B9_9GAMM|nr:hypothetical protein [Kineobactrum salinum]QIB67311.1 hypothetical protein G3T16_19835 [Kineobactrum salinum]
MTYRRIIARALALPVVLHMMVALAGESQSPQQLDPSVRRDYSGTMEMPDGIALFNLMTTWASVSKRNPDDLPHHVKMVTGLSEKASKHLVNYLLDLNRRMNKEINSSVRMLTCTPNVGSRSISEYALIADTTDDISEGIYKKYYMVAIAQLPQDEIKALGQLVDATKSSSSYLAVNHSEDYHQRPVEYLRQVFQTYCDRKGDQR